ncbi:M14 family metallopeptidase [Sediminibacillus albus]|uniref:G-D-glutamyl-meso-diaminopimelate peptidase n=1 Tax=Sediminibacillus albus TaxID=407036 RepID=A0A1G8YV69_9BACI|nr:M14 family metallocarboxypeptidase [Sediminibacillus albus]SDK06683.1 g-D-glutamyl-meso-diaminopimelate peptidase [Sediminibacillus albus]
MKQIVTVDKPYSYEQLCNDIEQLEKQYFNILEVEVIGRSVEERPIYAMKLGEGSTEIFLNGAHHAREWLTAALLMKMVEKYCAAYYRQADIMGFQVNSLLSKAAIWFVPMVNPDGVTLVQQGAQAVKQPEKVLKMNLGDPDFSAWKANVRGVDLNRQYPADWESIENAAEHPGAMNYKGVCPLSEPEAKAIYQFTKKHDFKISVAYHSSGEELYWKYKATGELLETTRRIAKKIQKKTGYQLVDPGANPSGGGFTDWVLSVLKKPALTPEISPYIGPRPVPLENFPVIWQQNDSIGLLLAEEAIRIQ